MGQPRAGFIPYIVEDQQVKMLFMKPSNPDFGGPEWQIAKGKIDKGESTEQAALREAKEELGLFRGNLEGIELLGTFLKSITIYIGKVNDKELFGVPSFETDGTQWLTLEQFMEQGRGLHKPIIQAAHRRIIKKEGE